MKLYAIIALEALTYTVSSVLMGLGLVLSWPALGIWFVAALLHDYVYCPLQDRRERIQRLRK